MFPDSPVHFSSSSHPKDVIRRKLTCRDVTSANLSTLTRMFVNVTLPEHRHTDEPVIVSMLAWCTASQCHQHGCKLGWVAQLFGRRDANSHISMQLVHRVSSCYLCYILAAGCQVGVNYLSMTRWQRQTGSAVDCHGNNTPRGFSWPFWESRQCTHYLTISFNKCPPYL